MMNDKIIDLEIVEQSNLDLEISNNEILELETSISFPKEAPTDYSKLSNLPKINDNTLVGNLTSNDLAGIICDISTIVSAGSPTDLSNTTNSGKVNSSVMIYSDKTFTAYIGEENTTEKKLYGTICSIQNKEITIQNTIELNTLINYSYPKLKMIAIDNSHVLMCYSNIENKLSIKLFEISENNIVTELSSTNTAFSTAENDLSSLNILKIANNNFCIIYSNQSDSVSAFTFNIIDNQIIATTNKKVTSRDDIILGIAKENGTVGDTIQIYIPNYEEE